MKTFIYLALLIFLVVSDLSHGFTVSSTTSGLRVCSNSINVEKMPSSIILNSSEGDDNTSETANGVAKKSLEEKMKDWEATDEEMRNASLGGVVPGRSDGFDIGLMIAFPFIVGSALLFAVFPFIMDKIDVSSVGPPPTV